MAGDGLALGSGEASHTLDELLIKVLPDVLDELGACLEADILDLGHLVHLDDRIAVVRGDHLGTIAPVSLIAVVLLGVVRGGDHHPTLAAQLADSEGDLWRRTEALEEIDLDAIGGEDLCRDAGEDIAIVAAVMADSYGDLRERGEFALEVVGQPLRRSPYRVAVHAIRAYAHNPTQPTGAELEVLVEGLY